MPKPVEDQHALRAECGSCFGLCCVALPLTASADFAADKAAGTPCTHLREDFGCGIHGRLRAEGFPGCEAYDCFGAGQRVSRQTFGGRDWRRHPETAEQMFAALPVVQQLHQLLWYLDDALTRTAARGLGPRLRALREETDALAGGPPEALAALDVAAHRGRVDPVLERTSALVRARVPGGGRDRRRADLLGARLRDADLRGADLRGSLLIAADLTGADLREADLIGADLRDARLHGADLTGALFLTRPQLASAQGDLSTRPPHPLAQPAHWRS